MKIFKIKVNDKIHLIKSENIQTALKTLQDSDFHSIIQNLIDDEIEAINGYNEALQQVTDENIVDILTHIRDEEVEHKEELEAILNMKEE